MAAPSLDPLPTSPQTTAQIKTEDDGATLTTIGSITQDDDIDVKSWTKERHKSFEDVLAGFDEEKLPASWETVASMLLWADAEDLKKYFDALQEDVGAIDAGKISLPNYNSSRLSASEGAGEQSEAKKPAWAGQSSGGAGSVNGSGGSGERKSNSKADQERRKGIPWTEEEHRLFLLGLAKYGKGDWRSISRTFVISRTPTQVASHAQKYFIRLNSINKDKRRSSIHDITSVNGGGGDTMQDGSPGPITGQSPSATPPAGQPHAHGMQPGFQAAPMYGHPGAPAGSPVGNPVYPPRQMPFGARGHMQRPVMSGPPMMPHMGSYPMPQQAMNH